MYDDEESEWLVLGEERLKLQVEPQERLTGHGSMLGIAEDLEVKLRGHKEGSKREKVFGPGDCVWSKVKGGHDGMMEARGLGAGVWSLGFGCWG